MSLRIESNCGTERFLILVEGIMDSRRKRPFGLIDGFAHYIQHLVVEYR